MPRKKKILVDEEPEQVIQPLSPLMLPQRRPAQIESNPTLRLIGREMANATKLAKSPASRFDAHTGLLNQLQSIYDHRNESVEQAQESFFTVLQSYLEQAHTKMMHTIPPHLVEESLHHLRVLLQEVEETGHPDAFGEIASYLLLIAHAPLDQF